MGRVSLDEADEDGHHRHAKSGKSNCKYFRLDALPPFILGICFCGESLDWARGQRCDLRKHRPGSTPSSVKTKGIPQRKAEGLRPRLVPWKNRRLVISRSAALSPCPADFEVSIPSL